MTFFNKSFKIDKDNFKLFGIELEVISTNEEIEKFNHLIMSLNENDIPHFALNYLLLNTCLKLNENNTQELMIESNKLVYSFNSLIKTNNSLNHFNFFMLFVGMHDPEKINLEYFSNNIYCLDKNFLKHYFKIIYKFYFNEENNKIYITFNESNIISYLFYNLDIVSKLRALIDNSDYNRKKYTLEQIALFVVRNLNKEDKEKIVIKDTYFVTKIIEKFFNYHIDNRYIY